jgi:hypothetical protein
MTDFTSSFCSFITLSVFNLLQHQHHRYVSVIKLYFMFTVLITALNMSRYQIYNVQRFPSQPSEWTEAAPVARRDYKWVTKRHLTGLSGLLTSAAMT